MELDAFNDISDNYTVPSVKQSVEQPNNLQVYFLFVHALALFLTQVPVLLATLSVTSQPACTLTLSATNTLTART